MNLRHALAPGLVAVACATAAIAYATRPTPASPPQAPPVAVAAPQLAGLVVGEVIAGWTIREIAATTDGVAVRFDRDRISFAMTIAPLGASNEPPPFASKAYALYYGHPRPSDAAIPAGALRAISAELIRRLDRDA
jgi:hypothetical protein